MTAQYSEILLPELAPQQAKIENALSGQFAPFTLILGKARFLAELASTFTPAEQEVWLIFTLDGADSAVQIGNTVLAQCLGQSVEYAKPSDVALLLEDALADWLDVAEASDVPTTRFQTIAQTRPSLPIGRTLKLRGQSASGRYIDSSFPLALSLSAAERLATKLSKHRESRTLPRNLFVEGLIGLNGPSVSEVALKELRPGDGLCVPYCASEVPSFFLTMGQYAAPLLADERGYRLASSLRLSKRGGFLVEPLIETNMNSDVPERSDASTTPTEVSESSETIPDVNALPIQLSFKIGETSLSIGEIKTLGTGSLITVPGGPDATLEILANGSKIGIGELVAIGEKRAVRVISLS